MKQIGRKRIAAVVCFILVVSLFLPIVQTAPDTSASSVVRISSKQKKVQVGKTVQLAIRGGKDLVVTWTSLNPAIATVDSYGVVKGVVAGETTVVANVSGFEFECAITVFEKEIRSLSVKGYQGKHFPGEVIKLTVTTSPADAKKETIQYSSDQPGVATVDADGVIKCVAAGTAKISASVRTSQKTITKTVSVKVLAPFLKLSKKTLSLKTGQVADPIKVQYCTTASVTCTWATDNESVASVDSNGKITAKGLGVANITARYNNLEQTLKVTVRTSISSVRFPESRVNMAIGDTKKLQPSLNYSISTSWKPAISFESNKPEVAYVDNEGNVVATGAGTARITAIAEGKKGTCTIVVK